MKDDKTIGDAANDVKNAVVSTKLSSIKKVILIPWKLALLGVMVVNVTLFFERYNSVYGHWHWSNYLHLVITAVAFIEFFSGIITKFIFKDRP